MDKINLYSVYQNNYCNRTNQAEKKAQSDKADDIKGVKEATVTKESKVELSQSAKDLLKELKEKYGNMDFIIADYETDEEAASYLSRGTSEYSVLLTPEELEKMAADENKKNENLAILDEAVAKLDEMKNQLGAKRDEVKRLGIAIGENGEVSFFAELEKVSEKQRQRIEKAREEKKAASKDAEAKEAKAEVAEKNASKIDGKGDAVEEVVAEKYSAGKQPKHTYVYASTTEELMLKIADVDWDAIKEAIHEASGHKFDFTV